MPDHHLEMKFQAKSHVIETQELNRVKRKPITYKIREPSWELFSCFVVFMVFYYMSETIRESNYLEKSGFKESKMLF